MPRQPELVVDDLRAILEDVVAGSTVALARVFELYSADVHRVAYRLTMSVDDAEDVLQDVFIGLPEALASFTRGGAFASWLRAVTVRRTLMRMRSNRRREATARRAVEGKDRQLSSLLLDTMSIATALAALPEGLRVAFLLADVEGYTHAEIGKMLGIRTGTSEVRLHRARRKLRALLGEK